MIRNLLVYTKCRDGSDWPSRDAKTFHTVAKNITNRELEDDAIYVGCVAKLLKPAFPSLQWLRLRDVVNPETRNPRLFKVDWDSEPVVSQHDREREAPRYPSFTPANPINTEAPGDFQEVWFEPLFEVPRMSSPLQLIYTWSVLNRTWFARFCIRSR